MGKTKVIKIFEHHISIPLPNSKEDIYLYNEKKENAYWRRIEFPDFFHKYIPAPNNPKAGDVYTRLNAQATIYDHDGNLISLSEDDTTVLKRLIKQDLHRRIYGMHMKCYDQVIWVAPDYYYCLQWLQMKDLPEKYGNFRWIQNDVMIAWWYAKMMNWVAGIIYPKCKKSGLTQIFAGAFLNEAQIVEGFEFGAASKEFDHVCNVFMAYYFHAFDNQPTVLKPTVAKRNLHEIIFGREIKRTGSSVKLRQGEVSDGEKVFLGTRVNAYKTKTNCFDGPVLKRGFVDEAPKWWESSNVSPDTVFLKNIEAVKLQQQINGTIAWGSYMPEVDDRGFREFKEWCDKSLLATKNKATGRTESNLIVMPIYADESNEQCFDKYGRCDRKKAYDLVKAEKDQKTKLADKLAHQRQYPLNWNDMFDSGGQGTVFPNDRLAVQMREVEECLRSGVAPWKFISLDWEKQEWNDGGKKMRRPRGEFSPVKMNYHNLEDVKAKGLDIPFYQFDDFPEDFINKVIRKRHRHLDDDCYCPILADTPGVFSFDPTDYVLKKDVMDGSTFSGHGGFIYDSALDARYERAYSNIPIIDYYMRHDDPDDDYENLVKLIILTGWFVIVESNNKWVLKSLRDDKLHHFVILKDTKGVYRPFRIGDEMHATSATTEVINDYCRKLNKWMAPSRHEGDYDYIEALRRPKTIEQLMSFDPMDTKRYDSAVSLGWWRIGIEAIAEWIAKNREDEGRYDAEGIQTAFDELLNVA